MKADYDIQRLDELICHLLDGDLSVDGEAELGEILGRSRQARDHYRTSLRIHAALIRHSEAAPGGGVKAPRMVRWKPWIGGLAAAACLAAVLWIVVPGKEKPVAWLSGSRGALWSAESPEGDLVSLPLELQRGFAEVMFRNGVRVTLEGPCRFEVTDPSAMEVAHGRASVKAPVKKPAGFEFHLDTPGGRLTDLGTEFGVSVGNGSDGPVVLTEVFDGEIEVPAAKGSRQRMQAGDSAAILKETGGTQLVTTLDDYPVDLGNVARRLPSHVKRNDFSGNLALGKPVATPAYLNKPQGSVFPPDNLTDGRLNDTGSPGDWSFWLAPDGETGEFTVDLLQPETINRVMLQNTRNRRNGDRGLREFMVLVSDDAVSFHEVCRGELQRVAQLPPPGTDFPSETFSFPDVRARYVKIVGLSHYRNEGRRMSHHQYHLHSGGLNEIMIFGP